MRKWPTAAGLLTFITLSSTALLGGAGDGLAAPLLKSSSASESLAAAKFFRTDKTLKRKRLVTIDLAVLEQEILPAAARLKPDRASLSQTRKGELTLDLFRDAAITLKNSRVEAALNGGVVWSADGGGNNFGVLVVNGARVTGYVEKDGHAYLLEPVGNSGLHRVREVDSNAYPNDIHLDVAAAGKGSGKKGGGGGGSSGGGGTTTPPPSGTVLQVNLLAAYTTRANTLLGGIPGDKIALDVAIVNTGYANSGVPLHLNLVGVTAVSGGYDEKAYSDYAQPLYDLTSGTGYNFPAIRDMRNTLAADLVTMYADRNEYCGIAWVGGSASYAFSAINPACNGTATLAHELGHNMGLRHDRYVEAAASADVYNYGYVNTTGKFRTIMSYNNACSAVGVSCARITYYSTPKLTYSGYPIGIPQGTAGAADATRKLGENATAVSGFR